MGKLYLFLFMCGLTVLGSGPSPTPGLFVAIGTFGCEEFRTGGADLMFSCPRVGIIAQPSVCIKPTTSQIHYLTPKDIQ